MGKSATSSSNKGSTAVKVKPSQTKGKSTANKKNGEKGDPVDAILNKMAEMNAVGMAEVKEQELLNATGYKAHDSTGYRKATKKLIKDLGYISKQGKIYTLTEEGRKYLVESGKIEIPPVAGNNEELQDQLKKTLAKMVKAPADKLDLIWNKLMDGKAHTPFELVVVAGYSRLDSTGYRQIMKGLKTLELLEKDGKAVKFSDKVFQFGRP